MQLDRKLINAVIVGDLKRIEALLQQWQKQKQEMRGEPEQGDPQIDSVRDHCGNTLLHIAVAGCRRFSAGPSSDVDDEINCKILKLFLDPHPNPFRVDPSITNNENRTPFHFFHAIISQSEQTTSSTFSLLKSSNKGNSHNIINSKGHRKYLEIYLKTAFPNPELAGNVLDTADSYGMTPLHLAVKYKCGDCLQRLLKYGAAFNIKSQSLKHPFVTPTIFYQDPWSCKNLEGRLNRQLSLENDIDPDHEIAENDDEDYDESLQCGISFNFSDIVPKSAITSHKPEREMEFLETFLNADASVKRKIIGHPLVSSFVFMKREKVRWIFFLSFALHVALAIVYTAYVMTVYLYNCPYRSPNKTDISIIIDADPHSRKDCDKGLGCFPFSITLLIVAAILSFLEMAKLFQNSALFRRNWQNLFQVLMILCLILSAWPVIWTKHKSPYNWQYSAAAYGVFHIWATLLINVGRVPVLGIYVEMFGKVLKNFGYFMVAYISLLIAFSCSFCLVFPEYPPFETLSRSILKVITMMAGDLDFKDFFYEDKDRRIHDVMDLIFLGTGPSGLLHPITSHVLYGAFVILVTIVLTNLLIGLAVSDIKALGENASFTNASREIANISYVESIVFWLPNWCLFNSLRRSIVIARFSDDGKIPDTDVQSKGQTVTKLKAFQQWLQAQLHRFLNVYPISGRGSGYDLERRNSIRRNLQKYTYSITLEDIKGKRKFPEEIYLKARNILEDCSDSLADSNSIISSPTKIPHCSTCQCSHS